MQATLTRARAARRAVVALAITLAPVAYSATDAARGIEQALNAAQQDKRGITLYVNGQVIGGAVTRVEPGQWVELKNQTSSRIIVRIDRIDGVAAP
jgi:murein endopeptidase